MSKMFSIIKGTNSPIKIDIDEDISGSLDLSIVLFGPKRDEQKRWFLDDVTIEPDCISCPLTQEETLSFSPGTGYYMEMKRTTVDGVVVPYERLFVTIEDRTDDYILREEAQEANP